MMIPRDYVCGLCGAEGVKLWRKSATSEPVHSQPLLCGDCTEREQGHPLDLSESDQCWGRCPAVPDLRGGWYGYTSVPAEGCAWWSALPLRLTGEWKVRGGVERWMPYSTWTMLKPQPELRRVDWSRDRGMALAFVPDGGRAVTDEELTTLETLAAAATPGPWATEDDLSDPQDPCAYVVIAGTPGACIAPFQTPRNAAFIAAARAAVPALVAEVRRLRERCSALEAVVAALPQCTVDGCDALATTLDETDGDERCDAHMTDAPWVLEYAAALRALEVTRG